MRKIPHFLSITDLSAAEFWQVLKLSKRLKDEHKKTGLNKTLFKNKTLIMIFEKPSLRTRISFESGMTHLGGHAIFLGPSDIGMGSPAGPPAMFPSFLLSLGIFLFLIFFNYN